ncbi:hypothetical protein FXB39_15475 [Nocardioides sp. BGMRC 2183]|nr:hypothetical protein FXB39_15475 [Nocardioides sp. BGMRC 2183]
MPARTATPRAYERLEVAPVRSTAERLVQRMETRLPGRNLIAVGHELVDLIADVDVGSHQIRSRVRMARVVTRLVLGVAVVLATLFLLLAIRDAVEQRQVEDSVEWLAVIETVVNDVVFLAIAVFFLYGIPDRVERAHLLDLLHRLRSLAHIIDMHQLTKDPERVRADYLPSARSAEVDLDPRSMEAYLDYCSELLSLVGKTAALCAEESQDPVVLDTVRSVETLTTGLARTIWQKIALLPGRS